MAGITFTAIESEEDIPVVSALGMQGSTWEYVIKVVHDATGDSLREAGWQVLHIVDWGQTLDIARNPGLYHEINPVIGRHPSVGRVNLYMGLSAAGHLAVSWALPKEYRVYWQWMTIGVTGGLVGHNFNIGLRVRF